VWWVTGFIHELTHTQTTKQTKWVNCKHAKLHILVDTVNYNPKITGSSAATFERELSDSNV